MILIEAGCVGECINDVSVIRVSVISVISVSVISIVIDIIHTL